MNKFSKYGRNKFIIGLVSLMSMFFLTSAAYESNPQECELISVIKKKKKAANLTDQDNKSVPD